MIFWRWGKIAAIDGTLKEQILTKSGNKSSDHLMELINVITLRLLNIFPLEKALDQEHSDIESLIMETPVFLFLIFSEVGDEHQQVYLHSFISPWFEWGSSAHKTICTVFGRNHRDVVNKVKINMHFASVILLGFLCGLSESVDFCQEASNVTFYRDLKVENCGCDPSVCFRKCCKAGFYLASNKTCRASNTSDIFEFPVYKEKTRFSRNVSNHRNFTVGVLQCLYFQLNSSDPADEFFVQDTGTLWVPHHKSGIFYENTQFCVDEKNGFSVFVCFPTISVVEKLGLDINAFGSI